MVTRRSIVQGMVAGGTLLTVAPGFAVAMTGGERRFVFIFLRGAMDGLSAVPAYGEPRFKALRGELADGSPGEGTPFDALKLDGLFALNPDLPTLHKLYGAGELTVVHAACHGYRDRSHFDAQDAFDRGTVDKSFRDGWLNRALAYLPPRKEGDLAMAIGPTPPLSMRGDVAIASWVPAEGEGLDPDTIVRLAELYRPDAELGPNFEKGFKAEAMGRAMADGGKDELTSAQARGFIKQARAAAGFLRDPAGPRVVTIDFGNWDSHASQNVRFMPGQQSAGGYQGRFAELYIALDRGIAALKEGLGSEWANTAVMVITEFGRTVRINGNRGTDHGTGGAGFLLGGAVAGGRIIADWPGLGEGKLFEDRDLLTTTDLRALCKGVLREHLSIADGALETIFPDSRAVKPLEGLIRRRA